MGLKSFIANRVAGFMAKHAGDSAWKVFARGGSLGGSGSGLNMPPRPYHQEVWVYACITAISTNAARVPIVVTKGQSLTTKCVFGSKSVRWGAKSKRTVFVPSDSNPARIHRAAQGDVIETGALVDLLNQPNSEMTTNNFLDFTTLGLYNYGKVLWLFGEMEGLRPKSMSVITSDRFRVLTDVIDGQKVLVGWDVIQAHGGTKTVTTDGGIMLQLYDPYDPHKGLSPIVAATLSIASNYNASLFNASSFANGAEPGGVLEIPGPYSKEVDEQMREAWQQRHQGAGNVNKTAALFSGAKYTPLQRTLNDMAYAQGKDMARQEIAAAFRVPPTIAGFFGTTGDSSAYTSNELKRFWQDTEAPLLDKYAEAINVHLAPRFEGGQQVFFDLEEVPVAMELRTASIDQAVKLFGIGVPVNDINETLNLGLPEQDWYDTGFLPSGLSTAEDTAAGFGGNPLFDVGAEGDDLGGLLTQLHAPTPDDKLSPEAIAKADAFREAQGGKLWAAWMQSWAPVADQLRNALRTHYKLQLARGRTAILASGKAAKASIDVDAVLKRIFDNASASRTIFSKVGNALRLGMELGIRQAMREAGLTGAQIDQAIKDYLANPAVTKALQERSLHISKRIDSFNHKQVERSLKEGIAAGEDARKIADRVDGYFQGRRKQAMVQARSALGSTLSAARETGQRGAGMTHKSWLTSRGPGERRHEHRDAERTYRGAPIPFAQPFIVAGEELRYPRDPAGSPGNTINCQCVTIAVRVATGQTPAAAMAELEAQLLNDGFASVEFSKTHKGAVTWK